MSDFFISIKIRVLSNLTIFKWFKKTESITLKIQKVYYSRAKNALGKELLLNCSDLQLGLCVKVISTIFSLLIKQNFRFNEAGKEGGEQQLWMIVYL